MSKNWKDFLLRSGLPLENDVSRLLNKYKCVGGYEYSYLREDEQNREKEFSFDIDSSYIQDNHFFNLLIECKHRHPSTTWVFTPAFGYRQPNRTDFTHPIDYFIEQKFQFPSFYPEEVGPVCGKGIELTSTGNNEKSITQAAMQLAYAMPEKIADSISNQVNDFLDVPHIFYHVPIIITTAALYRLHENVSISEIEASEEIQDVADPHDILVMSYHPGVELKSYSRAIYADLIDNEGRDLLEKHHSSPAEDLSHFFEVLSSEFTCRAMLVVHYDKEGKSLKRVLSFLDGLVYPSEEVLLEIEKHEKEMLELFT